MSSIRTTAAATANFIFGKYFHSNELTLFFGMSISVCGYYYYCYICVHLSFCCCCCWLVVDNCSSVLAFVFQIVFRCRCCYCWSLSLTFPSFCCFCCCSLLLLISFPRSLARALVVVAWAKYSKKLQIIREVIWLGRYCGCIGSRAISSEKVDSHSLSLSHRSCNSRRRRCRCRRHCRCLFY